eukprot:6199359-Amphidinium_carterae.1
MCDTEITQQCFAGTASNDVNSSQIRAMSHVSNLESFGAGCALSWPDINHADWVPDDTTNVVNGDFVTNDILDTFD